MLECRTGWTHRLVMIALATPVRALHAVTYRLFATGGIHVEIEHLTYSICVS